ncbi:2-C-methyl-D-erythritol 2,4-cyclodiphosphate synthase [Eubacteriales bacterium OttesenSCG-928-N13]|nr:2-C-methyl-D-erythritol 2,4-cyclodiphosphate synthase [Eubacteriales bacterium OttesenSCG-928-N13]
MMNKSGIWALVVAAGKGERLGLPYNKVFHMLGGRSVLGRCFDALQAADCFEGAVLVLSQDDMQRYEQLIDQEGELPLVRHVAIGGKNRQQSVKNGLDVLPSDAKIVAIHDAARAFVPPEVVVDTVQSAIQYGSGVAATVVTDTIKRVDREGLSIDTPDRESLRAVQTPQSFQVDLIQSAHERAIADGYVSTDDAALMERYNGPVRLCCSALGDRNIKLTKPEDLKAVDKMGMLRIGQGYDVHRLVPDRKLILCGVEIPHELGLLGHSDADVATHALMDAMLGAAALGDIGRHFPDTDPRYKGISSIELLKQVDMLLKQQGYHVNNLDVTIIAQQPKLAGYMDQMRTNLAQTLGVSIDQINVKATTTENLGFEGRGEGISAAAIASLEKR